MSDVKTKKSNDLSAHRQQAHQRKASLLERATPFSELFGKEKNLESVPSQLESNQNRQIYSRPHLAETVNESVAEEAMRNDVQAQKAFAQEGLKTSPAEIKNSERVNLRLGHGPENPFKSTRSYNAHRVIHFLLSIQGKLEGEVITLTLLANQAGMDRPNFVIALNELVKSDLVYKSGDGRSREGISIELANGVIEQFHEVYGDSFPKSPKAFKIFHKKRISLILKRVLRKE